MERDNNMYFFIENLLKDIHLLGIAIKFPHVMSSLEIRDEKGSLPRVLLSRSSMRLESNGLSIRNLGDLSKFFTIFYFIQGHSQ